ncbi:MAG: hypothetical protein ABI557_13335, partial [Aureliella sp.]
MRTYSSAVLAVAIWLLLNIRCADAQTPLRAPTGHRHEVAVANNQMEQIRAQLHGVLHSNARLDPAYPTRMEVQTDSGLVMVEFRPGEGRLLIDGSASATAEISRLISLLSQDNRTNSLRALPLNNNGQASLAQSSLFDRNRQPRAAPFELPSFSASDENARLPGRLTAAQQEGIPAAPGQTNQQTSDQSAEQTDDQSPLPLQPFEGVQVEMLPEIDAIILRGREQQLQDLAEIIKRLDEA